MLLKRKKATKAKDHYFDISKQADHDLTEYWFKKGEPAFADSILGQKWGIRRYQNKDGSLTPAGRKRYFSEDGQLTLRGQKEYLNKNRVEDLIKKRVIKVNTYLSHSFKGTQWKNHKYVFKRDGRYYYSETEPDESISTYGVFDTAEHAKRYVDEQNFKVDLKIAFDESRLGKIVAAIQRFMNTPIVDLFRED